MNLQATKNRATEYKAVEGAAETAGRRWRWIYSVFPVRAVCKGMGFLHRLITTVRAAIISGWISEPEKTTRIWTNRTWKGAPTKFSFLKLSINCNEKCWHFLTYSSLDKMVVIFTEPIEAWISVELCIRSETSTFSGNTYKPKSREERLENKCKLGHI